MSENHKLTESQIIEGCLRGDATSQRELYERFSAVMFAICYRYVGERSLAQDILHDGFITIFTKVGDYRGEGSFEGWCKRIFINRALSHLRKRDLLLRSDNLDELRWMDSGQTDALDKMSGEELLKMISNLPEGYRTVLNLYAVEGYSHKEIGEMLGISENTSRSQYSRARERLMKILNGVKR